MKQLYKCDNCWCTGIAEEIAEHEKTACIWNPELKSCGTCTHGRFYGKNYNSFEYCNFPVPELTVGKAVMSTKTILNCDLHELGKPRTSYGV